MLEITIPAVEMFDDSKQEFFTIKEQKLQLEHSLVSLKKWESKWCKPFLQQIHKKPLTDEELMDYVKCMTITQNVNPDVYAYLSEDNITEIVQYINAPMTATTITEDKSAKGGREIVTAEIIYYWMIALNIPVKFEKWHLNSLLTLVKVCNIKNQPPKKRSRRELMSRNTALNAERRRRLNTKG